LYCHAGNARGAGGAERQRENDAAAFAARGYRAAEGENSQGGRFADRVLRPEPPARSGSYTAAGAGAGQRWVGLSGTGESRGVVGGAVFVGQRGVKCGGRP